MNLWKRLRKDWHIRVYMLLLAILLWAVVVMTQEYETTVDVPLVHVNVRPDKILVSDLPETIPVRFSGQGKDLFLLSTFREAHVELDLQAVDRNYSYPLSPELVELPNGVDVVPLVLPGQDTVRVELEEKLTRRLPIRPTVEVRTRAGYVLSDTVKYQPDSVTVSGPQSQVQRLNAIRSEERVFVGLADSFSDIIPLVTPKHVTLQPQNVKVSIEVDRLGERTINRVPVEVVGNTHGRLVILEPSVMDVRLKGPSSRLATLTPDSVKLTLNYNRWQRNQQDYIPTIELPDGVTLMDLTPDKVRMRLEVDTWQ